MTEKEKATRRYIFQELRLNPMIDRISVRRSGRHKGDIAFHFAVDESGMLKELLGVPGSIYSTGIIGAGEIADYFVRRSKTQIRQIIYLRIWDAFLGYEQFIIEKVQEKQRRCKDAWKGPA